MNSINNFKENHFKYKKTHQSIILKYNNLLEKLSQASLDFDKCLTEKKSIDKITFLKTISDLTIELEEARQSSENLNVFLNIYMDSIMDLYNDSIIEKQEYLNQMTSVCEKIESIKFNCKAMEKGINGLKNLVENL